MVQRGTSGGLAYGLNPAAEVVALPKLDVGGAIQAAP